MFSFLYKEVESGSCAFWEHTWFLCLAFPAEGRYRIEQNRITGRQRAWLISRSGRSKIKVIDLLALLGREETVEDLHQQFMQRLRR